MAWCMKLLAAQSLMPCSLSPYSTFLTKPFTSSFVLQPHKPAADEEAQDLLKSNATELRAEPPK